MPAETHILQRVTLLWSSLFILSTAVSAISPTPVSSMAYVTIDENILLIQGGINPSDKTAASTTTTSKQFFSLDFTTSASWNTTSPPWTQLNVDGDSGPASFGHSLLVSPNRRNITVWDPTNIGSRGIMTYSLDNHQWTKVGDGPKEFSTQGGLQAVAHPTNGLVYIPSGTNSNDGNMMIFDLLTSVVRLVPMPPRESNNLLKWYGYSFVWSEIRNSFLIFGGGGDVGSYFYEYSVANNSWTDLTLAGNAVPPRVKNACLVPAYNGTKILLFGGLTSDGAAVGTLYTLDVRNMIWSLSESTQSNQNRYGMACSVSGDNLVIWGGQSAAGAVMSGPPLIYSINTEKWTTKFIRGTHYTDTGRYSPPPMTSPAEVGGALTAGIVAVVAAVGFIFYRRRKNRRQKAILEGQSHQFYRMQESDMSLNSIVSPPPITGALTQDGSHGMEQADKAEVLLATNAQAGRNRLYGSHSNAQPISLSQKSAGSNVANSNNNNIINLGPRPIPSPPAFFSPPHTPWHDPNSHSSLSDSSSWATPPTNPSWPSSPANPTWPTPPTPSCPSMPAEASSSSSSASPTSSRATPLPQTNHPSAPPPPYPVSPSSSHAVIFRKEAVTDLPTAIPPINPAFKNVGNSEDNYGTSGGYDRKVEELQHQLAAHKEELSRRSIGLHPQFYTGTASDTQTIPKAVARNPQGAGDIVVIGSSSSNGGSGQTNEELQQQVLALQIELSRLQAMIGQ